MEPDSCLPAIRAFLSEELRRPPIPQVDAAAAAIRQHAGPSVAAILFYGSCLREGTVEEKIIDFYLVVDGYRQYYDQGLVCSYGTKSYRRTFTSSRLSTGAVACGPSTQSCR